MPSYMPAAHLDVGVRTRRDLHWQTHGLDDGHIICDCQIVGYHMLKSLQQQLRPDDLHAYSTLISSAVATASLKHAIHPQPCTQASGLAPWSRVTQAMRSASGPLITVSACPSTNIIKPSCGGEQHLRRLNLPQAGSLQRLDNLPLPVHLLDGGLDSHPQHCSSHLLKPPAESGSLSVQVQQVQVPGQHDTLPDRQLQQNNFSCMRLP